MEGKREKIQRSWVLSLPQARQAQRSPRSRIHPNCKIIISYILHDHHQLPRHDEDITTGTPGQVGEAGVVDVRDSTKRSCLVKVFRHAMSSFCFLFNDFETCCVS